MSESYPTTGATTTAEALRAAAASPPPPPVTEEQVGLFKITRLEDATTSSSTKPTPATTTTTIAVLFGWLGAQDKHLKKYAYLFHSLGVQVVARFTAPSRDILFVHRRLFPIVSELLRMLSTHYPSSKVVLCYWSNGGCFLHWKLLQLLQRRQGKKTVGEVTPPTIPQIVATIFDSCPAYPHPTTAARAASAAVGNKVLRVLAYVITLLFQRLVGLVMCGRFPRRFFGDLEADPFPCPSLYIYSKDDSLTDYHKLKALVEKRRARRSGDSDSLIEEWVLESSLHVSHYLRFPQEYQDRLRAFLTNLQVV